ncbi:MAG TPA: hypothetical protein VFH08_03110 [Chitinophagaceae bacterium]|nr:hypothetical protein [Chitinophagaceae bacterium]
MFFNLFRKDLSPVSTLFLGHYVDPKVFFTVQFNKIPCISFIGEMDVGKAFDFIQNTYVNQVVGFYQHNYFDHDERDFFSNNTLFVLKNKRMIELGNNYCQVLYTTAHYDWGQTMIKELSVFHVTGDVTKVIGFARSNGMN